MRLTSISGTVALHWQARFAVTVSGWKRHRVHSAPREDRDPIGVSEGTVYRANQDESLLSGKTVASFKTPNDSLGGCYLKASPIRRSDFIPDARKLVICMDAVARTELTSRPLAASGVAE